VVFFRKCGNLKAIYFSLLLIFFSSLLVAQDSEQIVLGELDSSELFDAETSSLVVKYQATNASLATGLGLRLHFDSSQISIGSYTERLNSGVQPFQIVPDDQNYDNDTNTDRFYLTSWADFTGVGWPVDGNTGEPLEQPVSLYSVPIAAAADFSGTTLRFTASSVASGYTFKSTDIQIGKRSGSLDIDGNKSFDALTDGLLILRSMFGLSGDTLILGTVASDALYTSASEIQARIDAMGSTLDIDNNSSKDALSDGLIILRYLFGLRGDVLISGVVASDAKRTSSNEIERYLESLMSLNTAAPIITSPSEYSVDENQTEIGVVTATDDDGDQLTYFVDGEDQSSVSIGINSGILEFNSAPDFEEKNFYSIDISVSDGENEVTQSVLVNINNINDAPSFNEWFGDDGQQIQGPNFQSDENNDGIFGEFRPSDQDGDEMIFSVSGSEIEVSNYDKLRWVNPPDYEAKAFYEAVLTISDGDLSTSQPITVTIRDIDDTAPNFTSSNVFSANENQTSVGTVTATDIDSDDSLITFSVSGSELLISSDGILTFANPPDYETKPIYTAEVTASDGTNSASQNITVNVIDVFDDQAPIFTSPLNFSVPENQISIGTVTATGGDGGNLTYSISGTDVSFISLDSSNGVLTFNSEPDYETKSSYSVTVTASDGTNSTDQDITIFITNLNDNSPLFSSNSTFSVDENQKEIGIVIATDADGDLLNYSLSGTNAGSMNIDPDSGVLMFKFAPDYENKTFYTATVTVSDGQYSTSQILDINILNVIEPPYFVSKSSFSAEENQFRVGVIQAWDVETNSSITNFSISGDELVIGEQSILSFVIEPDYEIKTEYTATISAIPPDGRTPTTQDIIVTIIDVDDVAPVFNSSEIFLVDENQSYIGMVSSTDADSDDSSITYNISGSELLIASDGALTFASVPDYESKSSYSAIITASDGINSATQSISVSVNNLNDNSPVFTSPSVFSANENQNSIGTATASDDDGDDIEYSVSGFDSSYVSIEPATGLLEFNTTPNYEQQSSYSIDIVASDGEKETYQAVTISILNINEPPYFRDEWRDDNYELLPGPDFFSNENNDGIFGAFSPRDPDGDQMVFSITGSEIIVSNYDKLRWVSAPDYETKSYYEATLTISDGELSVSQAITVTIRDLDDTAPVINTTTFSAAENQTSIGNVTATDVDTEDSSITFTISGSELLITSGGILTFASAPDYETKTSYTATVTASDGSNSSEESITVNVTDENDNSPLITSSATFSAAENQTAIGTVTATDADGDALTYSLSGTDESSMSINSSSGVLTFSSAPDYETKSSYSATVTASDGTNSSTQAITVSVTDVDDAAPVFT